MDDCCNDRNDNYCDKESIMRYDYTVEKPKADKRRYIRNSIKAKMKQKKKLGYKRHEAVYDKDLLCVI